MTLAFLIYPFQGCLIATFEPEAFDSESMGHGGEVVHGNLDSLSPERVGSTDW